MRAALDSVLPAPDTACARLYGEPLLKLPRALYIPPDALEVFFETFEGPLDLLLYLIRRQNFNVLDIPMTELTRQYLEYIERIRARNLEHAAAEEGNADPRAELARRLLEYERIKGAARALDALPQLGRDLLPVAARH